MDTESASIDTDSIGRSSTITTRKSGVGIGAYTARYRWSSNFEYIMTILMYSVTVENYTDVLHVGPNDANMIQYIACVFVVGMPLQYMQVALGQYTQLAGTNIKYLSPIGHGIGYCFMMTTVYRMIPIGVLAGDFLLYLLNSLQTNLPWLECSDENLHQCWAGPKCEQAPCVDSETSWSGLVYWNCTFRKLDGHHKNDFSGLDLRRLVTCMILWVTVYFILVNTTSLLRKFMRYFLVMAFCVVAILLLFLVLLGKNGHAGFSYILDIKLNQFGQLSVWTNAIIDIIIIMNVSKGGYILLGSYLVPNTSSGILTVISIIAYVIMAYMFSITFHVCLAMVIANAKTDRQSLFSTYHVYRGGVLSIIPHGLGFNSVPQLWSFVYFFSSIVICLAYILINIRIIEISIQDSHINFYRYRKYLLFAFLVICPLASIFFVCSELYEYADIYFLSALDTFDVVISFIFTVLVSWIYGVQKLCDDIHFITGGQPTKFWKICWYILPLVLGVASMLKILQRKEAWDWCSILVLTSLFLPLIIMAIIETFRYIRKRNLVGLFQPEERWGPPDPHERHLRQVFNPRKEIRSRRRNEACQHKCLLNSNVLKRVIGEESRYHMYNTDIDDPERDITDDRDIDR